MLNAGYVYVLMNPSMDGLVKIGRTTRDPQSRISELSSATGVPTPFVLVHYAFFDDCIKAETYIHTILEQRGLRVTGNREFFNMPINEAIDIIVETRQHFVSTPSTQVKDDDLPFTCSSSDNFLDELNLVPTNPWNGIWESAEDYYYGLGDTLQDHEQSMKLYKQAAKLGCSKACLRLGMMYRNGEGCIKDLNKALEYLKEGARRGDYLCYAEMYQLFEEIEHHENARKCWDRFIDLLTPNSSEAVSYCFFHVLHNLGYDRDPIRVKDMHKLKDKIIEYGMNMAERFEDRDVGFAQLCRNSAIYVKNMA